METNAKDTAAIIGHIKDRVQIYSGALYETLSNLLKEAMLLPLSDMEDEKCTAILEEKIIKTVNQIMTAGATVTLETILSEGYTITRKDKKE